jgi:hypothetical protein
MILALTACTAERLFPQDVANGVARLSVNNLGQLIRALNHESIYQLNTTDKRPECNFRSLEVTDRTTIYDDSHGHGYVTREFTDCEYDFGSEGQTIESPGLCGVQKTTFYGKVKVSGSRRITGILTKNNKTPVIPSGQEGIDFYFTKVSFQNYRVESSGLDKAMTIASGSAAFDAKVHLAKSRKNGLCEIPLPNLTLSNIRFSHGPSAAETIVVVPGPLGDFQAAIDSSFLHAQVGVYQDKTNHLEGTIQIWGKSFAVPTDEPGLNPYFIREEYEESLTCDPDLYKPLADDCPYEPDLAGGIARLTVKNLGNLMATVADPNRNHEREECLLGSLNHPPTLTRKINEHQVELLWEFSDCEFDFSSAPTTEPNYFGKVKLSGTRKIIGFYLEGNTANPVIPGNGGVEFSFNKAKFENFTVESRHSRHAMKFARANIAFDVGIHLAKGKSTNVCSVVLPNLTLTNIRFLESSELVIPTDFGDINFSVSDSNINAQVYRNGERENAIDGTVHILGTWVPLQESKLDPDYKPMDYDALLNANAELQMPLNDDCESADLVKTKLADGIARLTVNNFGNLLRAVTKSPHERPECQLGSMALTTKAMVDYEHNSITWHFDDCDFNLDGNVRLTGTKTISGTLTTDPRSAIVPSSGSTVDFHFTKVTFDNYHAPFSNDTYMINVSGSASFDAQVHLARSKSTGLCMVPIANLALRNVRYLNDGQARVALVSKNIGIQHLLIGIDSSNFDAQVGFAEDPDQDNRLRGTLEIYKRSFNLPTDGLGLNPFEDHAKQFEATLQATPDLATTDRTHLYQCEEFEYVRALNVARLLVLNMGSITQEAHDEYLKGAFRSQDAWLPQRWPNCGFSSNRVRARSTRVKGRPGELGELHFHVNKCKVVNQTTRGFYPEDCLGEKTVFEGRVSLTGTQKIEGHLKTYARYFDDIVPNHPRAITFAFDDVSFDNFSSYYLRDENAEPKAKLLLKSGSVTARVRPVLSPKKGTTCEFFRSTPVVGFHIRLAKEIDAELHLNLEGFAYSTPITISQARLTAQNGVYQGSGNSIRGDITVNNRSFRFDNEKLNPDYDQDRFNQSYECRERYLKENEYSIEYVIPHWEGWKPEC